MPSCLLASLVKPHRGLPEAPLLEMMESWADLRNFQ